MSGEQKSSPVRNSYWIIPDRFRAGEYPGSLQEEEARSKIRWLLNQDIDFFIDLTEPGECDLRPYDHLLHDEAIKLDKKVTYQRMPIEDYSVPGKDAMEEILQAIDNALSEWRNIYLHCLGGAGRTGVVVGCYLAEHGFPGDEALEMIELFRHDLPNQSRRSPETEEQRRMVKEWKTG